jgi:hypothetical protein
VLDDHVDANLFPEREVLPNLGEQRLRRPGEVATVAKSLDVASRFQMLPGRERPLDAFRGVDARSEVPVDGTTELINPDLLTPLISSLSDSCPWTLQAMLDSSTAYPKLG